MKDSQQVQEGKVIKFGLNQIVHDTPLFLKYISRGGLFLQGFWALIPYDMVHMDKLTYGDVTRWLALINSLVFFAIKFFGWDAPKGDPPPNNNSPQNT